MKRFITAALLILFAAQIFAFGKKDAGQTSQTLTVGATPEPHASILRLIQDDLANKGITLKIVEFQDYVTPNEALQNGETDANFFQHQPYLDQFNAQRGYSLVSAGGVLIAPIALYSLKHRSIDELGEGARIAIPNDPTNEGRALLLIQSAGLITLNADAGITATPLDIASNPLNLQFIEADAASLPRVLEDTDAAVINGTYALPAGLKSKTDGILVEGADSPYVNVVAVKSGMENDPRITALMKALRSKKVADWIAQTYPDGELISAF